MTESRPALEALISRPLNSGVRVHVMSPATSKELFFAYTVVGSAIGAGMYAVFMLVGVAAGEGVSTLFSLEVIGRAGSVLALSWVAGMVPAGVAAAILVLMMAASRDVRDNRMVRVALSGAIGAAVSITCIVLISAIAFSPPNALTLAKYGIIGAVPAVLLAGTWPKTIAYAL